MFLQLALGLAFLQSPVTIKTTATLEPVWEDVRGEWYRMKDCEYDENGGMGCKRMIIAFGTLRVKVTRNGAETPLPATAEAIVAPQNPAVAAGRLTFYPKYCKPLPGDLMNRHVCTAPRGERILWISVQLPVSK